MPQCKRARGSDPIGVRRILREFCPNDIADLISEYAESPPAEKLAILLDGPGLIMTGNVWIIRSADRPAVFIVRIFGPSMFRSGVSDDMVYYSPLETLLYSIERRQWHLYYTPQCCWQHVRPFTQPEVDAIDHWLAGIV